jgi:hypothetical protein
MCRAVLALLVALGCERAAPISLASIDPAAPGPVPAVPEAPEPGEERVLPRAPELPIDFDGLAEILAGGAVTGSAADVLAEAGAPRSRPEGTLAVRSEITGGDGDFDGDALARILHDRRLALIGCFARGEAPRAARVALEVTVQVSGATSARATSADGGPPDAAECVVAVVRRLRLEPAPVGGSAVHSVELSYAPRVR